MTPYWSMIDNSSPLISFGGIEKLNTWKDASFCWKFKLIDQISSLKSMNCIAQELKGIFMLRYLDHSLYVCFLNQIFAVGCNVTNVWNICNAFVSFDCHDFSLISWFAFGWTNCVIRTHVRFSRLHVRCSNRIPYKPLQCSITARLTLNCIIVLKSNKAMELMYTRTTTTIDTAIYFVQNGYDENGI